jgi:hypothetical protein
VVVDDLHHLLRFSFGGAAVVCRRGVLLGSIVRINNGVCADSNLHTVLA